MPCCNCRYEPRSDGARAQLRPYRSYRGLKFYRRHCRRRNFVRSLFWNDISTPVFLFGSPRALAYINWICMILLFHETHTTKRSANLHSLKACRMSFSPLKTKSSSIIYAGNFFFHALLGRLHAVFTCISPPPFFLFDILHTTFTLIVVGALWSFSNFVINRQLAKRFFPGDAPSTSVCFSYLLLLCHLFLSIALLYFLCCSI